MDSEPQQHNAGGSCGAHDSEGYSLPGDAGHEGQIPEGFVQGGEGDTSQSDEADARAEAAREKATLVFVAEQSSDPNANQLKRFSLVELKAVGRWVLVELDESPGVSPGGILIPELAQKPVGTGFVVTCGRGYYNNRGGFVEMQVKPGDRVSFKWFDAQRIDREVRWGGNILRALRDDEIVGIVEE